MKLQKLLLLNIEEQLPVWANWIAQSKNGEVTQFEQKPLCFDKNGDYDSQAGTMFDDIFNAELAEDWQTPLEVTDTLRKLIDLKLSGDWVVNTGESLSAMTTYEYCTYDLEIKEVTTSGFLELFPSNVALYREAKPESQRDKIIDYVQPVPSVSENADDCKEMDLIAKQHGCLENPTAECFLKRANELMVERGAQYDSEEGERSIGKTIEVFNTITGHKLKESDGWLIMEILKNVRQWSKPSFHMDSAEDGVSYSALKAEALAREAKQ